MDSSWLSDTISPFIWEIPSTRQQGIDEKERLEYSIDAQAQYPSDTVDKCSVRGFQGYGEALRVRGCDADGGARLQGAGARDKGRSQRGFLATIEKVSGI